MSDSPYKDRAFLDTNVLIYLYSSDEAEKRLRAASVFDKYACITSTQALNEFCNVCTRKWKLSPSQIIPAIEEICACCSVSQVSVETVRQALALHARYGYSYYDCLIISSAIQSGCLKLLTEDLADGQVIEGRVRIINVFAN